MRFAVFGSASDALSLHTEARIREHGHDALLLSLEHIGVDAVVAADDDDWFFEGEDLRAFDGYVLRRFPSPHRVPSDARDKTWTLERWWQVGIVQRECSRWARAALASIGHLGRPMVNPWMACQLFDEKAIQLEAFRRAGLAIPPTCVTNSTRVVRAFARRQDGPLVAKPLEGGAHTRLVDPEFFSEDVLLPSPTIFQPYVRGDDVRVTIVDGKVVSAVEIDSPSLDVVDYRESPEYQSGEARYRRHALSSSATVMCTRAAEISHHVLSGVDLKRTRTGTYVLLEANSAPMYLDIERKMNDPITDAVVDYLISAGRRSPQDDASRRVEPRVRRRCG
ncbi:MAG: hypothetical protein IPK13_03720 [Deltaproteobacteria bacterium]|nr:hypothetical protein [Deltaproteobacteria bacterium]